MHFDIPGNDHSADARGHRGTRNPRLKVLPHQSQALRRTYAAGDYSGPEGRHTKEPRMSQEQNHATETQIEPLSDESLENVSGGVCSISYCSPETVSDNP
jgi:hypothetical protein